MPRSDQRQIAADARRVAAATGSQTRETTAKIRAIIGEQYRRGVEAGRAEVHAELEGVDARSSLLGAGIDFLQLLTARVSSIPNSHRTQAALREAEGILRDAQTAGEPTAQTEPEEKQPRTAKKGRSNGKKA